MAGCNKNISVLYLGSNVFGKKGEMRVPEEQAFPHQTEDSGIQQRHRVN